MGREIEEGGEDGHERWMGHEKEEEDVGKRKRRGRWESMS